VLRRTFVAGVVAAGGAPAAPPPAGAQTAPAAPADRSGGAAMPEMPDPAPQTGYAPVNGLRMYYEVHGTGRPLVLLHGAFSAIGTSFGKVLPGLAATRQVIGLELQGHGRTADIDRPLSLEQLAEDTAALLRYLQLEQADVFGYSVGAAVGLRLALRHPELVRRQALASVSYTADGLHPGLLEGLANAKPEQMYGSPWHEEYLRLAPHPEQFDRLFAKKTRMDRETADLPAGAIRAIEAPTPLVLGDADIVRPEHAVELFRLLRQVDARLGNQQA
jgi:pimeloyl-ACP methyl ester carboxylesterase